MSQLKSALPLRAAELQTALSQGTAIVILDVRYTPGKNDGKQRYLTGHIPGAIYVDLPTELAASGLQGRGSMPLPDIEALERTARACGLDPQSRVVVYDDSNGAPAAKAWWVLRWAGLADVRVLDGGLNAWLAQDLPLTTDVSIPGTPGAVRLSPGHLPAIEVHQVLAYAQQGVLLDARPEAAYAGPSNPASGHIPGAVSLPAAALQDARGRLLPVQQIRERAAAAGVRPNAPTTVYCGGGVAASFVVYALNQAGLDVTLYPGSWSEWIADPARPVER